MKFGIDVDNDSVYNRFVNFNENCRLTYVKKKDNSKYPMQRKSEPIPRAFKLLSSKETLRILSNIYHCSGHVKDDNYLFS